MSLLHAPDPLRSARHRAWRCLLDRLALLVVVGLSGPVLAQPVAAAALAGLSGSAARGTPAPIVVHGDQAFGPYEFLEDGVAKGLNVDLFREIARRLGRPLDYRLGDWPTEQAAVIAGRGDVLPPIAKTPERVQTYHFTQRVWSFQYSLFARSHDVARIERTNPNQLQIGVTAGGLPRKHFQAVYPQAQLVLVKDNSDGMRRLLRGEIDVYAGPLVVGQLFLTDLGIRDIVPVAEPFVSLDGAIAVHKRNPALLADLDQVISQIKADGTLDRLRAKWEGPREIVLSRRELWLYAGAALGLLLIAALLTGLALQRRRAAVLAHELVLRQETEARLEVARQEAVSARQTAEAAARAKGEFLANMSHEIRTPMNAIVGLTRLLRRGDPGTRQQNEWLGTIDNAAQHLVSLVGDVLDIAKIESGKLELEEAEFNLQALLQSVASQIGAQSQEKGLAVVVDAPPITATFVGDPTRLRQALLNLASNAVKFTERGGITLRARVQALQGDQARLLLECEDTGPGLAADIQSRVFEAFEQGSTGTTRTHGGTGLGLSITKHLASLMGGEVGVDSAPGQGARFWFTAQVLRCSGATPHDPSPPGLQALQVLQAQFAGARILVAEDNEINLLVTRSLIEDAGLVAVAVRNGQEAVEQVAAGSFDLVLMDMQMPVMDGMAATVAIRRTVSSERLPILAVTANAFSEDRRACYLAGMDAFISKPVDPHLLYEKMLTWLQRQRSAATPLDRPPSASAPGCAGADAPSDKADRRLAALAAIDGVDVQSGLRKVLGHLPRCLGLVDLFLADAQQSLAAALRRDDPSDGAQPLVHRLRGSAMTLGFDAMAEDLLALELAWRAGPIDAERCRIGLSALLAQAQRVSAQCPAPPAAAASPDSEPATRG